MINTHESANKIVLTFGKYKGSTLAYVAQLDPNYLTWMADAPTMSERWKIAAKQTLAGEPIHVTEHSIVKTSKSGIVESVQQLGIPRGKISLVSESFVAIEFDFDRGIIDRIKAEVDGRKWNPQTTRWEAPLVRLKEIVTIFGGIANVDCDDDVKKAYINEMQRKTDLNVLRKQDDTDLEVPGMILPLRPYQKVGVKFVDRAGGRALIADVMGLGKTAQAIGFAMLKGCKTIIVCPASVKLHWRKQIKKFTGLPSTIWETTGHDGRLTNQFHIVGYPTIHKIVDELIKHEFELLVCDEATNLKNRKAIRTKAILGYYANRKNGSKVKDDRTYIGLQTKYVMFLTGTPIMNRPIEAFTLYNFISKERFHNFMHFVQRYGGWRGEPAKNLKELHERSKDIVIRRLLTDVELELPPKERHDLFIELDGVQKLEYEKLIGMMFRSWRAAGGKPSVAEMPKIQQFLAQIKVPEAIEMIDELLEGGRSVVVFSCYKKPVETLFKHYGENARLIWGEQDIYERQKSIEDLSTGKARVGCVTLKTGGMGIDGLQEKIDTVIFLDQDWVPANHEQAEARAHRDGQKNRVQVYYMICENTIDEYMREVLTEKQRIIDEAVDGDIVSAARSKSIFSEVLNKMRRNLPQDFFDF